MLRTKSAFMESNDAVALAFVDLTSFALKMFTNWFMDLLKVPSGVSDSSQWYFYIHSCSNTVLCNNQHWVALQWQILLSTRLQILRPKCNCRSHSSLSASSSLFSFIFWDSFIAFSFSCMCNNVLCFMLTTSFLWVLCSSFRLLSEPYKIANVAMWRSRCNTQRNSHLCLQDFQDTHIHSSQINPACITHRENDLLK